MTKIELFYSPGCAACAAAREGLKAAAQHTVSDLDWRDLNVLENLDYAVDLGVLTPPSMAINGELIFPRLPTAQELRDTLVRLELKTAT